MSLYQENSISTILIQFWFAGINVYDFWIDLKGCFRSEKASSEFLRKIYLSQDHCASSDYVHANASSTGGHARHNLLVGSVGDTSQVHPLDTY